jgi:hypothetical protein
MKFKISIIIPVLCLILAAMACDLVIPTPQGDSNAFNTMVAQTASVLLTQAAPVNPQTQPLPTQPVQAVSDETAIKQALLAKLGWSETELDFKLSQNTGQVANGTVTKVNEPSGAAWFAGKDNTGKWVIAYIGQGMPNCSDIQAFNFPIDWISHCMDASGNTIDRSGNQPAPTNPPPAADAYAPDPLGPAWSGMWFAKDMCYDMDVLFHTTDASCDVSLDANSVLTPRNGAVFSGYATLTPPSLNTCKTAVFSTEPIAPNSDLYMCFKTNAGKYGFFVARQIEPGGIVFDAYVFP